MCVSLIASPAASLAGGLAVTRIQSVSQPRPPASSAHGKLASLFMAPAFRLYLLYQLTLISLAMWLVIMIACVVLKEAAAAGPGFISIAFVLEHVFMCDQLFTKLQSLKLMEATTEVRPWAAHRRKENKQIK